MNDIQPDSEQTPDASFALLEQRLESLVQIAPVDTPQQLRGLLPETNHETVRLILSELIKLDMATAYETDSRRGIDFYLDEFEDLLPRTNIPFDLVLEEVQLRKAFGETPDLDEYRQRFPDLAVTLGQWLVDTASQNLANHDFVAKSFSGVGNSIPELLVGKTVDDFEILRELGSGAFAKVYLARQISMHRLVALKASQRGSDEPQALSQLDHPNIVRVYDQRICAQPAVILLYMQYIAGGSLSELLRFVRAEPRDVWNGKLFLSAIDAQLTRAGQTIPEGSLARAKIEKMDWPSVVSWFGLQLADGLDYAAKKNVLHRDVKPANILLSMEGVPKLVDFNVSCSGIAGRAGAAAHFGGSLAYMSPEQLRVANPTDNFAADQLDGQTDLYSLAMVLWEIWQGSRPWEFSRASSSWVDAVRDQIQMRERKLECKYESESAVERVLEKTLRAMLSPEKTDRPQNGAKAATSLRLVLHPLVANRMEPDERSWLARWFRWPVLVVTAVLIFLPNGIAAAFNYAYNAAWLGGLHPEMFEKFKSLSIVINSIVFPVGAVCFFYLTIPIVKAISRRRKHQALKSTDLDRVFRIPEHAASIGAVLWGIAGIVFAIGMMLLTEDFPIVDALHFFLSLLMCGGVAWIYPFFGLSLLITLCYYPRLVAGQMSDARFLQRAERLQNKVRFYLYSAAFIPLIAMALLLLRNNLHRGYILLAIFVTASGLVLAYKASEKINQTIMEYKPVLAPNREQ